MAHALARCAAPTLALVTALAARTADAKEVTLSPGMAQAAVAAAIDKLEAGDTLVLMPGDYAGVDLDLKHADMSGVAGTAAAHIVITTAVPAGGAPDGGAPPTLAHVTGDTSSDQEAMRLRPGCAYIDVKYLHLSAVGSSTQAGIFVDSDVHDVTITNNVIENVTGIGIQLQTQSNVHDLLIADNAIYGTGTNTSDGSNGGQAFTAGGFDPSTATTGVYHLVVRHNLVHDTTGQEGDCLKFMYGVYASTFEDNVLYNCPRGVSGETENYGITSYGSGVGHYTLAADDNLILRNLVIGTAAVQSTHDNVAIYVGPGTEVVDNIVIASNQGIAARLESEATVMRNLTVINNTVLGATDNAFSIRGCQDADSSVVVTNNALFAVDANGFGYRMPDPTGSMVATSNYYEGMDYAEASPPVMNKLTTPLAAVFVDPTETVPGADLVPVAGSPLIGKGDPKTAPLVDFDLAARPLGVAPDVGAYQTGGIADAGASDAAPWSLGEAFKGSSAMGAIPDAGGPGAGGAGGSGSGGSTSGGAAAAATSSGCGCELAGGGESAAGLLGAAYAFAAIATRRRVRRVHRRA